MVAFGLVVPSLYPCSHREVLHDARGSPEELPAATASWDELLPVLFTCVGRVTKDEGIELCLELTFLPLSHVREPSPRWLNALICSVVLVWNIKRIVTHHSGYGFSLCFTLIHNLSCDLKGKAKIILSQLLSRQMGFGLWK